MTRKPLYDPARSPRSYRRKGWKRHLVNPPDAVPLSQPSVYKPSFPYDPHAAPWNEADNIAWNEDTTRDLIASLDGGATVEEAAMFLQYYEGTVRLKMKELGLKEQPHRRRKRGSN